MAASCTTAKEHRNYKTYLHYTTRLNSLGTSPSTGVIATCVLQCTSSSSTAAFDAAQAFLQVLYRAILLTLPSLLSKKACKPWHYWRQE